MNRVLVGCSLWVLLFVFSQALFAQGNTESIDTSITSILHPELNYIQFHSKSSLAKVLQKWSTSNTIAIAHMGDSHVQPDYYSGELRKNLQFIKGDGGRGMVFPYAIAKTYSANDYKSTYTGSWKCANSIEYAPKLALGVSGFTCQTFDKNASFTLIFKTPLSKTNRKIKFFCKKSASSYDFILKTAESEVLVVVDNSMCPNQPYIELELPIIGDTVTIQLTKQNVQETEFEFYGMSLESNQNDGLMVHCLGIGGARYGCILAQKLFQEHLPYLMPDLVILDFGTNDYLYSDDIPTNLEAEIKKVIKKVRVSVPNADILLTSAQDMNRKGKNILSGSKYSALIRKIAKEEDCAFYDWFWVSGGPRTITKWQERGLAHNDFIHLKAAGYKLKGQLLSEAFLNTMHILKDSLETDSLLFAVDSLERLAQAGDTIKMEANVVLIKNTKAAVIIFHTVKSGETLGLIALKYHCKVSEIMALNGLKNSTIKVGSKLKIKKR